MIALPELLAIVYRHYPRGVPNFSRSHVPLGEPVYDDTEEHLRLIAAAARGRRDYVKWKAMIDRIADRYSLQNESMHLFSGGTDPAYSARIYRPRDVEPVPSFANRASFSFHVSLLGPYYGIHDMGEPDEIPAVVTAEIEATYPGYQQIPPEIGNEIVPDVDMNGAMFGEATIYVCLFSSVWTWVTPVAPASESPPQTT